MKHQPFIVWAVLCANLLINTGCESIGISSRIKENTALFATLTPGQQKRIKGGAIDIGYTRDMVYIALGKPSKIESIDSDQGAVKLWSYRNFVTATSAEAKNYDSTRPTQGSSVSLTSAAPNGPSLFSTKQGGPKTELGFSDLPTDTLNIYLLDGKVTRISLKSLDEPDQIKSGDTN